MGKLLLILFLLFPIRAQGIELSARSAILMEHTTGKVLFEKEAQVKMKPASTTKILTALCAITLGNLEQPVTISKKAAYTEGSSMYLKEGEQLLLGDLVYGLMLNSGNDAAVAIAEHLGKDEAGFAKIMNQVAKEAGAQNSNFVNPNGLDHEDHYTTAKDLALITLQALKDPVFRQVTSTKTKVVSTLTGEKKYLTNHNKLLKMYEGCIGVKTGFTKASGRTLVSAAERNGLGLIAVTMNAPSDWSDHTSMLNYGFSNYELKPLLSSNQVLGQVTIENGTALETPVFVKEEFNGLVSKGGEGDFQVILQQRKLKAPVLPGEIAGKAIVIQNGKEIFRTNLYVLTAVKEQKKKPDFLALFKRMLRL